jgi:hypothetical protein
MMPYKKLIFRIGLTKMVRIYPKFHNFSLLQTALHTFKQITPCRYKKEKSELNFHLFLPFNILFQIYTNPKCLKYQISLIKSLGSVQINIYGIKHHLLLNIPIYVTLNEEKRMLLPR